MIKVKEKIAALLFLLCMLSFTSCGSNTLSESSKNTTENLENTDGTEMTEITEAKLKKNTEPSETAAIQTANIEPLSAIDFTQFKSMMSEDDYAVLEEYFPVLNEDLNFNYHNHYQNEVVEVNLHELREKPRLVNLYKFTVCDLDNDDVKELILCFGSLEDYVIFHKENDDFFATVELHRGFQCLQNNGVHISSGGAPCNHYQKLFFENGEFSEQELGHSCAYEDDNYTVNGNPVSEEEFQQWKEEIMTGDVEWYYP